MKIKVLDKLFFIGFIGPCLLAFFIVEFVLIMQSLWKEIDDILGKGYGMMDYLELIYYFALMIVPMALPLTILLSSVMVYGDMAEKNELSSAKSSGISFIRLVRPGLIVAVAVFLFSIFASNVLKPNASEGFYKKIRNMKTNQMTFVFDEQIFNKGFKDFSIRIGRKDKDGRSIDDVLIYDQTDADHSVVNMIRAKKGEMYTSRDNKYLIMDLKDGYQVREIREESADRSRKGHNAFARPMARFRFASMRKVFDLSEMLDLNMVNVSYKKYEMMNTLELLEVIDSMDVSTSNAVARNIHEFILLKEPEAIDPPADIKTYPVDMKPVSNKAKSEASSVKKTTGAALRKVKMASSTKRTPSRTISKSKGDLVSIHPELITDTTASLFDIVTLTRGSKTVELMEKNTHALRANNNNNRQEVRMLARNKARYVFSLHQIYSWASVCIIFLFIGAPAGAIVRKGGFGYPILIAIGFYLTFVMSSIIGKKLMMSGALSAEMGAWLPSFLLLPFAIYLSWRALHDNRPILKPLLMKLMRNKHWGKNN